MPTYSFGEESPLKFEIPDKLATNYNSAVEEFFKAHRRFLQKYGRRWDPVKDPTVVRFTHKQKAAWNRFAKVLANTVENDGRYFPNDIMDDYLVKNTVSAAISAPGNGERWIGIGVTLGALYVLLRGL